MKNPNELSTGMKSIRFWSICMAVGVFAAFSVLSIVLALIPLRFTVELERGNIMSIEFVSGDLTDEIYTDSSWLDSRPNYEYALDRIMGYIERGRRTNRFANTFFHGRTDERIIAIPPRTVNSIAGSEASGHFLRIEFHSANPQFSLSSATGGDIQIMPADYNADAQIKQIIIPLGNIERGFNEVVWFISLQDERNVNFTHSMTTFMNLYGLKNFTEELRIPMLQV